MKKKITALVLVVAVLAMLFTGMTLAYFTDTDSAVNVFTVGDVDIELDETVGVTGTNGEEYPEKVVETGATYTNVMPGNNLQKEVTVTNLENPAYVRVTVIVNNYDLINAMCEYYENKGYSEDEIQAVIDEVFVNWGLKFPHVNGDMRMTDDDVYAISKATLLDVDSTFTTLASDGSFHFSITNMFKTEHEENQPSYMGGNGVYFAGGYYAQHLNDYELCYTYYFDMEKGGSATLFTGLCCPEEFNQELAAMFNGLNIEIYAAAIQKEGFADAKTAFEQLNSEFNITDMRGYVFTDAAGLADALANAEAGDTIKLTEDVANITIGNELTNVTIDAQGNNVQEVVVTADAKLTNVTLTNLDTTTEIASGSYRGVVQVQKGATVENLVIKNSTFNVTGGRSAIVGSTNFEPTAEVTLSNCEITGPKYVVYTNTPLAKVTVEDCEISNVSSWAVQMNSGDTVGTQVTITGNTFTDCNGGMAKWLGGGAVAEGGSVVFTNNTLKSCVGHDGKDSKWFEIKPTADQLTLAGNTLDGKTWTPGAAQGLGQ